MISKLSQDAWSRWRLLLRELRARPLIWAEVPPLYIDLRDAGLVAIEHAEPRGFLIRLTERGVAAIAEKR